MLSGRVIRNTFADQCRELGSVCAGLGLSGLLAGCGGGANADACRAGATGQAEAEAAWGSVIEEHATAHTADADHSEVETRLLSGRVDVIIAAESTRRACQ